MCFSTYISENSPSTDQDAFLNGLTISNRSGSFM